MGSIDGMTKKYMEDPVRFADVFNYAIYGGRHVIEADDLKPIESVSVHTAEGAEGRPIERRRDGLWQWNAMGDGKATYALLGVENQTYVDTCMPVRGMLYDALAYQDQVDAIVRANRREGLLRGVEFLSGMRRGDKLVPTVTLVVFFGREKWDVPTSLHKMLSNHDEKLLALVPDYRVNLISPESMDEREFEKFDSELGLVLGYIKYANDKCRLEEYVMKNDRFRSVDVESVNLINALTDSQIKVHQAERKVDMCQAIRDIRQEGMEKGLERGLEIGERRGMLKTLSGLVRDGALTLAKAAESAGMSVAEFEEGIESL